MTSEQIEGLIKFAILYITPCTAITVSIWKYITSLETKWRESSVGATWKEQYEKRDREKDAKIDQLIKEVQQLREDWHELIEKITENFFNRK